MALDDNIKKPPLVAREISLTPQPNLAADNRIRQFKPPDEMFHYFASYFQVGKESREVMMSPLEFYSSITPNCTRLGGTGPGVFKQTKEDQVRAGQLQLDRSPLEESVLNKISESGLLSYRDYSFLLALLTTPVRYIDTCFNIFDVTGSGTISAKEFAFVSTKMAIKYGGFGSYTDFDQKKILATQSGLLNYLFGKEREKEVSRDEFRQLQADLLNEIIELEFMEYDKTNSGRISEADFVQFLLKNGRSTQKKRAQLVRRVEERWPSQGRGVSLKSFKSFFHVLAGSMELERALFFLDCEGVGVDKNEFRKISSWVSGKDTSDHVVEVLFELLDEDKDGRLQRDDMLPVLRDWRQARGYNRLSIGINLGEIRI